MFCWLLVCDFRTSTGFFRQPAQGASCLNFFIVSEANGTTRRLRISFRCESRPAPWAPSALSSEVRLCCVVVPPLSPRTPNLAGTDRFIFHFLFFFAARDFAPMNRSRRSRAPDA